MIINQRITVFLLSLVGAGLPTLILAQSRSQPGYVVTAAGDTLRGELTLSDFITEHGVSFRAKAQAPEQKLSMTELRLINLQDGRRFVKRRVAAARNPETGVVDSATVLLQHLVAGKVNFYRYDFNAARYRALHSDGVPPPERVQYFMDSGGPNLVQIRPVTYQAILRALFADCPPVVEQLPRTAFTETKLGNLVLRYDTLCHPSGPAHDYRLPQVPNPIRVLVSMRASVQRGKVFYNNSAYLTQAGSQPATLPAYGLELHLTNRGPWSLITGLHYAKLRSNHTQTEPAQLGTVNEGEPLQVPATVEVGSMQVPVLLRYSFGRARLQPYLAAGGLLGSYLSNRTVLSYTTLTYVGGSSTYYRNDVVMESVNTEKGHITFGGAIRAGLQLNLTERLAPLLEVQYSAGRDREYNPGLRSQVTSIRENLGDLHYRTLSLTAGIFF